MSDRDDWRPSDDVGWEPRPSLNGRSQVRHQDINCVPTLVRVGQVTQRQISIETFWT
jgi:hypothetical protein